jgi:putative ABC transport system ATP-binding protein
MTIPVESLPPQTPTATGGPTSAPTHGGSALIQVKNLRRDFKMGREIVRALDNVSLQMASGELVGITGSSGSGKSTLMYLLGGLDHPTSGQIWVAGEEITRLDEDGLAAYRQRMIGFIFQMFNLIPALSALDNVEFPLLFTDVPPAERRRRAVETLERVGLGDRMKHRPNELSGGQQQRVAIARALINNPAIILADEPTGNLDSRSGSEVMSLLKELNAQGRTVIIVSHDPAIIEQAGRSIRLHDGQVVDG